MAGKRRLAFCTLWIAECLHQSTKQTQTPKICDHQTHKTSRPIMPDEGDAV